LFPYFLIIYTNTSFFSTPDSQKISLKNSTLFFSQVAFVKLSLSFTHDIQLQSGLWISLGLTTTENDQNGHKFSFSLGQVHFVLFVKFVPIQKVNFHTFSF